MEHHIAILIKYIGPSVALGSRITMTVPHFKDSRRVPSITRPYDHSYNNTFEGAAAYLAAKGIPIESYGDAGDCYVALVSFDHVEAVKAAFKVD